MMQQTFNSQAVKSLSELLRKRITTFLGKVLEDEGSYIDANEKCAHMKDFVLPLIRLLLQICQLKCDENRLWPRPEIR